MSFLERLNNVYVIDTKMWGFNHYHSAYLIEGKELALIDTGEPNQIEAVRSGIKAHGFSMSDILYIFVTHTEHIDHAGNVAPLLRDCPKANVYINPIGEKALIDPSSTRLKERMSPALQARVAPVEPVPPSRIRYLNDGDVFSLGNGEELKIIFSPGHQPSGIVILGEKNNGLFINDLVGNYLADADSHYPLLPLGSDPEQIIESLKKLLDLPVGYLYLGHYGICDRPREIMARAIDKYQQILEIGRKYMSEKKPEVIADKVYEAILPELEKLRLVRGEAIYQYASREHIPFQAKLFAKYCQERLNK
jgi:glyoxylase-like metal-dependent hydrolase (beta-lactamase superfamily II)